MKIKNIKLVTYFQRNGEEMNKHEVSFKTLSELKKYIKECGGIKSFKWDNNESSCMYFITGEYNGDEAYYEYKYGKYQWFDCNGYTIK